MKCLRETFPCHVNKSYSGIAAAIADTGFERALKRVTNIVVCILYVVRDIK